MALTDASIGARIRQRRERCGMLAQDLATAIGLDPSAVSNIETGKRSVKTGELTAIADALGVSPLAILDDQSLLARLPTAARADDGQSDGRPLLDRLRGLAELHEVLANGGIPAQPTIEGVPDIDVNDWKSSADVLAGWAHANIHFDAAASDYFDRLADSIERDLAVDVIVEDHTDESIAGAAITDWSFPLIFVRAGEQRSRGLFTLAHELGHVLARDDDTMTIDRDLRAHNDRERLANAFAAAYLMPEDTVRGAVERDGIGPAALANLLLELGVSYQSLVYRLHNLGFVDYTMRNELQSLGMRGMIAQLGHPELAQRLLTRVRDDQCGLGHRPPIWLAQRALEGFRKGVVSVNPAAQLFGIDPEELLDMLTPQDEAPAPLDPPEDDQGDLEARYSGVPA